MSSSSLRVRQADCGDHWLVGERVGWRLRELESEGVHAGEMNTT